MPTHEKRKPLMKHILFLLFFAASAMFSTAQTIVILEDVVIQDQENTYTAPGRTVQLDRAEGTEETILFAGNDLEIKAHFKVSTHKSPRSSVKDSAVNLEMTLYLYAAGKKDKRRVDKIYYMDQDRSSAFKETFIIKNGIDIRKIEVSFAAQIK